MNKPKRSSMLGALLALTLAENQGDVMDEVFFICDAIGIGRPTYSDDRGRYAFGWEEDEWYQEVEGGSE